VTANPRTGWQAHLTGDPHVTNAGRLALPLELTLDSSHVARVDLVLDGRQVSNLQGAFEKHLEGPTTRVATPAESGPS
jgi:hypothetical protein